MTENFFVWFRNTFLGLLGFLVLWLLNRSLKWRDLTPERTQALADTGRPAIVAFWHGRQMMMAWVRPLVIPNFDFSQLSSMHRDGRLIATVVSYMGIKTIDGSSSKGGHVALKGMVRELRAGGNVGITPDGPRGPIHKVKGGVIQLAKLSGSPIYPLTYGTSRYWQFGSWDRMILPKPFSRAFFALGEPIQVPRELDDEGCNQAALKLEAELNAIGELVDGAAHVG